MYGDSIRGRHCRWGDAVSSSSGGEGIYTRKKGIKVTWNKDVGIDGKKMVGENRMARIR